MRIVDVPIAVDSLLSEVAAAGHGASCFFLGTVRDVNHGRAVVSVAYDAHRPLAEKVLSEIVAEAEARWGATVAARHRLGRLSVGEASVAVAAGSAHRAEAFAACRHVIEEIKKRLPIWKKESYADGGEAWLDGCGLAERGGAISPAEEEASRAA